MGFMKCKKHRQSFYFLDVEISLMFAIRCDAKNLLSKSQFKFGVDQKQIKIYVNLQTFCLLLFDFFRAKTNNFFVRNFFKPDQRKPDWDPKSSYKQEPVLLIKHTISRLKNPLKFSKQQKVNLTWNSQPKSTILFARNLKSRAISEESSCSFASSPSSIPAPTIDSIEKLCWALFSFKKRKANHENIFFRNYTKNSRANQIHVLCTFFSSFVFQSYNNIIYKTAIKPRTRERNTKPVFVFPSPTKSRYKFISFKRANSEVVEKETKMKTNATRILWAKTCNRLADKSSKRESFQYLNFNGRKTRWK